MVREQILNLLDSPVQVANFQDDDIGRAFLDDFQAFAKVVDRTFYSDSVGKRLHDGRNQVS